MHTAITLTGTTGIFAGFLSFREGSEDLGFVLCLAGLLTVLIGVYALWFNDDSILARGNRQTDDK